MKKLMLTVAAGVVLGLAAISYATQVNPTSNVLGDTAATAGTLVLRDSNGEITGAQITAATIDTAKIASGSVDTLKLNFKTIGSVDSGKIVCITPGNLRQLGVCTNSPIYGACTCQ